MKRLIGCAAAMLVLTSVAVAQPAVATVEITGGKVDLKDVYVTIPLRRATLPTQFYAFAGREKGGDGRYHCQMLLNGQLGPTDSTMDLVMKLPTMKAGERKTVEIYAPPPPAGFIGPPRFMWFQEGKDTVELRDNMVNKRPIARYTYFAFEPGAVPKADVLKNPTIKPYHHVFSVDGKTRLTNGPDGKYPHHRGIFFGFNNITYGEKKKADVWHCRNGEHQQARAGRQVEAGYMLGQHRTRVDWIGQDGTPFALETRELAFIPTETGMYVDFRSRLTTELKDGVKLDGDPQHAGFHFRAHSDVEAAAKETYFLRPDGKGERGQESNWEPKTKKGPVNLPWNAMSFMLDGKRRTVLYIDHPDNPKEARQSERTYGRIGTYFEYKLTPDKPLFVRYRLWIQDGEMTRDQCEALSHAFTEPVKVEMK